MPYDAFISYSHSVDGQLAPALQSALHKFAKPWWKMRAVNVFRDGTSLAAAHDLSEAITTALASSQFFVFLAAPRSAQSKWCQREVEYWIKERPPETLLLVLTEGTILWDEATGDFDWSVTDALPRALSGVFKAEPLWLDLSWAKSGDQVSTQDARFHQAVASLAARLHGKSLDEIAGEDVRQHRRTRLVTRAAAAGLAALTLSSLAGAWFAMQGQRRAERNLEQAMAATDTMVTDVAEGLRNFYGVPRDKLASILTKVEGILAALSTMEESDALNERRATMMRTLAHAYMQLGEVDRASVLVRNAETLLDPLAQRLGPESEAWRVLSALQTEIIDLARRRNDYKEAWERTLRYQQLNDAMVAKLSPATKPHIRYSALLDAVLVHERRRNLAVDQGRLDDALDYGREAIAASEVLLVAFPNEVKARMMTASARSAVASLLSDVGRPDDAMADLDKARTELIDLDNKEPNRLDVLRTLIDIEKSRGGIFENRGDWVSIIGIYENCVRVLNVLRAADPKNASLTAELAYMRRKLAIASQKFGDHARAAVEFTQASELHAEALRIAPDKSDSISSAVTTLLAEATFLESRGDRQGARTRLDRAIESADPLVRQRGADDSAILTGIAALAQRAEFRNFEARATDAILDLERAEWLLADMGRPAAPSDLFRAVDIVVDLTVQWGYAARLDRSLALVDGALDLYTAPRGVSLAASVNFRGSIAKLLQQRATALVDSGKGAEAIATMERAVAMYETDILPHTNHDGALVNYADQFTHLGRVAQVAGNETRTRDAYCAIAPKLAAATSDLSKKPRVHLIALNGEFLCLQARFFLGEREETEKLMAQLAPRVDDAVPWAAAAQIEWRALRGRIAQLRAGMRVIANDPAAGLKLMQEAISVLQEAVKIPLPRSEDLASLAFMHSQLSDALGEAGDTRGAVRETEASLAVWRKAVEVNGVNYQLKIKVAEAQMALAELHKKGEPEKALALYLEAADDLGKLHRIVPQQGRKLVLDPWSRAFHNAGDVAYDLNQHDQSVIRQRQALEIQIDLAKLAPKDVEAQLDLGRQHSRYCRALLGAKNYAPARAQCQQARTIFTAQRAAVKEPDRVDRLIGWTEKVLAKIAEDSAPEQTPAAEQQ